MRLTIVIIVKIMININKKKIINNAHFRHTHAVVSRKQPY